MNNLGAVHFELGDIEAAEIVYRRAVEINPQYADALTNLGSIYHEKARGNSDQEKGRILLTQAIGYYRRTLSLLPNHPLAYANMGLAYFDLGDWERARQAYERAYFLDPRNDKVLNNMGNLYATVGSRHSGEKGRQFLLKARHYYQEAIRINPANPSPRHGWRYVEGLLNPEQ